MNSKSPHSPSSPDNPDRPAPTSGRFHRQQGFTRSRWVLAALLGATAACIVAVIFARPNPKVGLFWLDGGEAELRDMGQHRNGLQGQVMAIRWTIANMLGKDAEAKAPGGHSDERAKIQ